MNVIQRVTQLDLPLDKVVVIGSGLLDAWGLRRSSDVDLVVAATVFRELEQDPSFKKRVKYNELLLERDMYEIWQSWGQEAEGTFEVLWGEGVTIDGVRFVSPEYLIKWKRRRGLEKDLQDIKLLEEKMQDD